MEREGGFHRSRKHAKSSSVMAMLQGNNSNNNLTTTTNPNPTNPNPNTSATRDRATPCVIREQDQYMPIANVIRIMRRILPPHAKISDDAKETIQECVSEYISFITGEANERCQREQRKTVTAEDVLWAMSKLGFDDYIEPLTVYLNRYRESENDRSSLRGDLGFLKRGMDYGPVGMPPGPPPPPPPYGPGFSVGHLPGMFDGAVMGGYYRDGSGAGGSSSGQNALAGFDPYGQFKYNSNSM